MTVTQTDIRLHSKVLLRNNISYCSNNVSLNVVVFGNNFLLPTQKKSLNSVRKDTILDDPSRKTIRTNPSTVSEGKPMVQPFRLSEDYPITGVNICLAVPRNGPQKIKPSVVGCSPRVRLCEVQRHCLFWGMYVLTKTFRNLHKRDDSTPCPHGNFNSIGVS